MRESPTSPQASRRRRAEELEAAQRRHQELYAECYTTSPRNPPIPAPIPVKPLRLPLVDAAAAAALATPTTTPAVGAEVLSVGVDVGRTVAVCSSPRHSAAAPDDAVALGWAQTFAESHAADVLRGTHRRESPRGTRTTTVAYASPAPPLTARASPKRGRPPPPRRAERKTRRAPPVGHYTLRYGAVEPSPRVCKIAPPTVIVSPRVPADVAAKTVDMTAAPRSPRSPATDMMDFDYSARGDTQGTSVARSQRLLKERGTSSFLAPRRPSPPRDNANSELVGWISRESTTPRSPRCFISSASHHQAPQTGRAVMRQSGPAGVLCYSPRTLCEGPSVDMRRTVGREPQSPPFRSQTVVRTPQPLDQSVAMQTMNSTSKFARVATARIPSPPKRLPSPPSIPHPPPRPVTVPVGGDGLGKHIATPHLSISSTRAAVEIRRAVCGADGYDVSRSIEHIHPRVVCLPWSNARSDGIAKREETSEDVGKFSPSARSPLGPAAPNDALVHPRVTRNINMDSSPPRRALRETNVVHLDNRPLNVESPLLRSRVTHDPMMSRQTARPPHARSYGADVAYDPKVTYTAELCKPPKSVKLAKMTPRSARYGRMM